jgi:hypothetical protein
MAEAIATNRRSVSALVLSTCGEDAHGVAADADAEHVPGALHCRRNYIALRASMTSMLARARPGKTR